MVVRLAFVVLLVTATMLTVSSTSASAEFGFTDVIGVIVASLGLGLIVLLLDALTPNKRLVSVVGVYLGLCVGLVGALAIGALVDTVANAWGFVEGPGAIWLGLGKVIVGLIVCYFSVSIVLTTKDDFRLVIPYVEFSHQARGVAPLLLDTSVLVDGRLEALAGSGLLDAPLVIPSFVVDELQALADSADKLKRARGRRGLDAIAALQASPRVEVRLQDRDAQGLSTDRALVDLARREHLRIVTTDSPLQSVAGINGVQAVNIHELAGALRPTLIAGEEVQVELVRTGEHEGQGVGFLPDGTMVVVDRASERIGQRVEVLVSNTLQTGAGRIVFAKLAPPAPGSAASMAQRAVARTRPGNGAGQS